MTARVVSLEPEEGFNPITLAGHREEVRAARGGRGRGRAARRATQQVPQQVAHAAPAPAAGRRASRRRAGAVTKQVA